jgi:acyl-CoA reductase-like NAD-dependent aldehyde dehydrogenase
MSNVAQIVRAQNAMTANALKVMAADTRRIMAMRDGPERHAALNRLATGLDQHAADLMNAEVRS